jgi:hypothetical protein
VLQGRLRVQLELAENATQMPEALVVDKPPFVRLATSSFDAAQERFVRPNPSIQMREGRPEKTGPPGPPAHVPPRLHLRSTDVRYSGISCPSLGRARRRRRDPTLHPYCRRGSPSGHASAHGQPRPIDLERTDPMSGTTIQHTWRNGHERSDAKQERSPSYDDLFTWRRRGGDSTQVESHLSAAIELTIVSRKSQLRSGWSSLTIRDQGFSPLAILIVPVGQTPRSRQTPLEGYLPYAFAF